jgi:putative hydrolase of the HAD superfamily
VKAVLVDLDDTLHEERRFFASGAAAVAARVGRPEVLADALRERPGFLDRIPPPPHVDPQGWRAALLWTYRTHRPLLTPFPDVAPFLALCRARGLAVGVVTDGKATVQHAKVRALELDLDLVVCTDDLDAPKPSPLPFAAAAALLGVRPEDCAYLGDDPSKDFLGPKALGMATVRIARPLTRPLARPATDPAADADHVAPDLPAALHHLIGGAS